MLKGKMIALVATFALAVIALPASAANVALVGGAITAAPSDTLILANTWRLDPGDSATGWAWSFSCTGCTIADYNINGFGGVLQNPSLGANINWRGDFSAFGPSLPGYSNDGTVAGSMGGTNLAPVAGNGSDVVVGWITIHVTAASGSVTPFFTSKEGIGIGSTAVPTSFSAVTWTPEPGTAMLLALGMGGLGIMGRRNR